MKFYINLKIILLLICLSNSINSIAYDFEVDGIRYNKLSDSEVEVTFNPKKKSGLLNLPSKVTYNGIEYSVISIGAHSFYECFDLVGPLVIPNSITSIKVAAFGCCSGLTGSLTIPDQVKYIGASVFYGCSGFDGTLTIPNSVTSIGSNAFEGCRGFSTFISKIENPFSIDDSVFGSISSNAVLIVPNGTKNKYLKYSGWTKNFKEIIEEGNYTQTYLLSIKATGNGSASYNGISIKNNTQSFTVNEGISATISFTPDTGYRIKSVKLNNTDVTSSVSGNSYSFSSISADTMLEVEFDAISATTYNLSMTASGNGQIVCPNDVVVRNETKEFPFEDGGEFNFQVIADEGYTYTLSNTATQAGGGISGNGNNWKIHGIKKDASVTVKFKESTKYNLTIKSTGKGSVSFEGTTVRDNTCSFSVYAGTIATFTFTPDNGYRIKSVKKNNTDVTSSVSNSTYTIISISSDTNIEVEFEADSRITFADANVKAICVANWDTNGDGELSEQEAAAVRNIGTIFRNKTITSFDEFRYFTSLTGIDSYAFSGCTGLTSITIPNSVTSIRSSAFSDCSGLTSITIPNSVTNIVSNPFEGCNKLTSITVSNGNTKYDSRNNCNAIIETSSNMLIVGCKNTIIPNSVTSIRKSAFYHCYGLTSITIPNSVTSIGNYAFSGCSDLSSIKVDNNNPKYDSRNNCDAIIETSTNRLITGCKNTIIPNSVTSIGDNTFYDCSSLTSITIPNSVTSIGNYAFYNCSGLTSITIPNSLTSIGNYAFYNCSGLTSITIPNSVTSIGNWAFYDCSGLADVISEIQNPFETEEYVFWSSYTKATLTVPSGTKTKYQQTNYWNKFTNIKEKEGLKYSLSITASGYGSASYDGNTIRSKTSSFTVNEGSSATITFSPDDGYRIKSVKLNNTNVTSSVSNNKYTISNIKANTTLEVEFEAIPVTTYTLSIKSTGDGFVSYNGTAFRGKTRSFTVNEGTKVSISLTPDNGCRIKSVKENDTDVTSYVSNGTYTINSISRNTTVEVEFETIPSSTYSLSITATGYGTVTYDYSTIRNNTYSYALNEGESVTISISPDSGYRIKSVKENGSDVTAYVSNNRYTISSISRDTNIEVEFEAIPVPTYTLSITATGNGSVTYDGTAVRSRTTSFTVNEGTDATITFSPDNGNSIASVKLNNSDVTSLVSGNRYTINNITANTTLEVTFQEDVNALTVDGVNYAVVSQTDRTVKVTGGDFGQVLTVPATVTQNGKTWTVTGIDANALKNNTELAAVIWNPTYNFTATVNNPNLLLYVKSSGYAPSSIQNVVVNGTASNIVLAEAQSGNNFYCPQAFVAQKISYTHNYQMQTGVGESKGWETIALPFDVQTITHETKGTIVPFAQWNNDSNKKPFWLMELTGTGFVEAGSIKAYTPYIISMPNNPQYDSLWLLKGKVTFAASSVTVSKTENLNQSVFNGRTFIPCFAGEKADEGFYALNISNDWETNNSGMTEGSKFVLNMRRIHPFEAYMTSSSNAAPYFDVFDDMTTGIHVMNERRWMKEEAVYDLQGRKVENPSKKGVYIVNGKKKIIK